jgi:EAL domain-containing protein (putative c-di-GMP-specific phosphodiesterase class I)
VNISALNFTEENFVGRVRAILDDAGLPPQRLGLEVTESVMVADAATAAGILRRLKALGLSVALDDFGAGCSSLSCLQSLPFDRLKIDRSFVSRLKRGGKPQAIVRAIVELGRGLGLSVIAEGVETRGQLAILREIGCSQFQGFLIGRPSPLAECTGQTRAA